MSVTAFVAAFVAARFSAAPMLITQLSSKLGRSSALLFAALASAGVTSALAAVAGAEFGRYLSVWGQTALVAAALAVATVQLIRPPQITLAQEPTRSLGAIILVLSARQIPDPTRALIFAGASLIGDPVAVGLGGGLGSFIALALAWQGRNPK